VLDGTVYIPLKIDNGAVTPGNGRQLSPGAWDSVKNKSASSESHDVEITTILVVFEVYANLGMETLECA